MGLIRLVICVVIAFGAGVLYERSGASTRCEAEGGTWAKTNSGTGMICRQDNG